MYVSVSFSFKQTHLSLLQFNNTLAPYKTCPNAQNNAKSDRGVWYVTRWADIYLKDARARLATEIKGFDLTVEDVYTMQQMCAYEVCFCRLLPPQVIH